MKRGEKREKGRYEGKREEGKRERYHEEKKGGGGGEPFHPLLFSYLCFIEQQDTLNIINPLLETTRGRENDACHLKFWSNIGCDSRFFVHSSKTIELLRQKSRVFSSHISWPKP